jgi:hypothetical protein
VALALIEERILGGAEATSPGVRRQAELAADAVAAILRER